MPLRADLKASTLAVHAGTRIDPATGASRVPIYRTSAFAFSTVAEMEDAFSGRSDRFIYTRYGNPSLSEAEACVAALEGAEGAVVFASGMAAVTAAVLACAGAGDHVVAQRTLYGGTTRLFESFLSRLGIEVSFAGLDELDGIERLVRPNTKALYLETPTNPTLDVVDIEAAGAAAARAGLELIVDNTFASPVNQRPLGLGAGLVVHSATKFLAGHGDLIAGVVAGNGERLESVRSLRKETGAVMDPGAAWILSRSLRTLPLRIRAQNSNAAALARALRKSPRVLRVLYPGLESHPGHAVARRQMSGFGGMLSFEVDGGAEGARRFVEGLEFVPLLPTLGGVETSVLIPALSSHSMISAEARRAAGVADGLVRLSAGVEDEGDLVAEVERALGRLG